MTDFNIWLYVLRRAVQLILDENTLLKISLRRQCSESICHFEFTGCGAFLQFDKVPSPLQIEGCPTFVLGELTGEVDDSKHSLFFDVFIRNGLIDFVELSSTFDFLPETFGKLILNEGTYVKTHIKNDVIGLFKTRRAVVMSMEELYLQPSATYLKIVPTSPPTTNITALPKSSATENPSLPSTSPPDV